MVARRFAAILLLLILPPLIAKLDRALSAEEMQTFQDQVTGTTLLIPRSLAGQQKRTKFGTSWQNENITISTLVFPPERPLRDIYETIKKRPGRRITRDEYSEAGFVLEGADRDGARFIVRVKDEGTKRGISVVY